MSATTISTAMPIEVVKKMKTAKAEKPKVAAVAVVVAAAEVDVNVDVNVEVTAVDTIEPSLTDRITECVNSIVQKITAIENSVVVDLKVMKADLKNLQKDLVKLQKVNAASNGKRKRAKPALNADGTVAPRRCSGLQKPTGISDQLADFLNISRGTLLPRMEVTRRINEYIKEHNLQNPNDRRKLLPNKELHAVLGTTADTEVSYFNYQGFLKGHFISTV